MPIQVIDTIKQKNDGTFPVADVNDLQGGYYQVKTIAERDAIPNARRKVGMLCFCELGEEDAENQLYQWNGNTWEIASLGGGGIISVESQVSLFEVKMSTRYEGMLAYVKEDEKTYQLVGGIEDENWVLFSGGGGGSGTVANLSCDTPHSNSGIGDAPIVAAPSDASVTIPYFFSSPNLGAGTLFIVLTNGTSTWEYQVDDVPQTPQKFTFPEPFEKSASTYNVTMWAVDRTGQQSNKVFIRYQVAMLELTTTVLNGTVYQVAQNIKFPYNISNALNRPVKVKEYLAFADGAYELKNEKMVTNWGTTQYFNIGALEMPGQYSIKIEIMTEDEETKGNDLIRSFLVSSPLIPQVFTDEPNVEFTTDDIIRLKYKVAMAGKTELRVRGFRVFSDGTEEFLMQKDVPTLKENEWVVSESLMPGTHFFRLYVQTVPVGDDVVYGESWAEFNVTITQGTFVAITPVDEGMIAQFVVKGDTDNNSDTRNIWMNSRDIENGPHIELHQLNYTDIDGWHIGSTQEDMYVRLTGRGYGIFDYYPFIKDHTRVDGEEIKGWTFEILYRSNNVGNEEARVLSCVPPESEIPGFYIDTDKASIGTKQGSASTIVETDEWTHLTFVIHRDYMTEKDDNGNYSSVSFMFIYVNGVISRVAEIGNVETASFENAYNILLNGELDAYGKPSNFGSCDLREIRVYSRALDGDEIVRNYISTVKDPDKQKQEIEMNERGTQIPTLTVDRRTIGVDAKGNPILEPWGKTENKNKIRCHVEYSSLDDQFGEALPYDMKMYPTSQIYFQGNSSLVYAKKNYKIRFRRFADSDYTTDKDGNLVPPMLGEYVDPSNAAKWQYSPLPIESSVKRPEGYDAWIPEDTFTLKTDYMESSHASNPGSARYIHNMYRTGKVKRLTPPQQSRYAGLIENQEYLRSTVDGFPIRLVLDGVDEGIHIMLVDKNSKSTFGVKNYKHPETKEPMFPLCQSYEVSANSDISAGAFREDSLESIMLAFEPRFAPSSKYTDNLYGKEETFTFDEDSWYPQTNGVFDEVEAQKAIPHHLMRLVSWVKQTGEAYEAGLEKIAQGEKDDDLHLIMEGREEAQAALTLFKETIQGKNGRQKDYFDEGYLIDYYLFALTFGMVDNFGKNMFLTTWDGRIWYPNFYDMDSMLGIDNQGKRNRDVDLEIDDKDEVGGYHFNTSQSLLWVLTRNAFEQELKERYAELRDLQFFSYETAYKYYMTDFMDKIPKRDYNRDAVHKYLNITKAERASYLEICAGDRKTYVSRWIKRRIIFMDSLMEYTGEYFKNTLSLRVNLEKPGEVEIPIRTFSPQYVTIKFTTTNYVRMKCYPHKDTIFKGYIATSTNADVHIGNSEFIKEIGSLKELRISEIYLENATRLNKLDCSGSQMLKSLNIGPLKYLRELNCSGCSNLGSGDTNQGIDLSECDNLMYLNASSTKLVSILLPKNGSPLVELNVTECPKLETLKVTNQINLTEVPLTGCENLSEISFTACHNLETFNLPVLTNGKISKLTDVSFSDCPKIEALTFAQSTTLRLLNLEKMPGLRRLSLTDMSRADANPDTESIQYCLNLSKGLENLEELTVKNCNIQSVRFHKSSNHPLRTAIFDSSNIVAIHYGTNGLENENMNFEFLPNLTKVSFNSCKKLKEVVNFNYTLTNHNNLFNSCTALLKVEGKPKLIGSVQNLFNQCTALVEAPLIDLSEVTDAYRAYAQTSKLRPDQIPLVFEMFWQDSDTQTSKATRLSNMFENSGSWPEEDELVELPSLMLDARKFPVLTNVSTLFHNNQKICGIIPGDLFGKSDSVSSIQNVDTMFKSSSKVENFENDLFKPLKNLTIMSRTFDAANIAGPIPDDFFSECSKVTNAWGTFMRCSKLVGSVKTQWFEDMPLLENTALMFWRCTKLGTTQSSVLPDNMLASNKKLKTAYAMFYKCTGIGGELHSNLLGGDDEEEVMALENAAAMFAETNITGEVPLYFFRSCPNLKDIGDNPSFQVDSTYYNTEELGIFGRTKLNEPLPTDSLGYSILRYNTKLTSVNGLFRECTKLNTEIPEQLFYTNKELLTAKGVFYNCSSMVSEVPETIFKNNTKVTDLSYFFTDCSNLLGEFPGGLFKGLAALKDLKYFFKGCSRLGVDIPRDIFRGLTALTDARYFFAECLGVTGSVPNPTYEYVQVGEDVDPEDETIVIPIYDWRLVEKGLFEDCTRLTNLAGFFKQCRFMNGMVHEFLFRQNTSLSDLSEFFYNCNAIRSSIPAKLFETNRQLANISYMFYHCNNIDGYIPEGLFAKNTSLNNVSYAFAWLRYLEKYPTDDILTCVPADLFSKTPLVNAEGVFFGCANLTGSLPPLFSNKSQLKNIAKAFGGTKISGVVVDTFMNNCPLLENMEMLFGKCTGLTGIHKNLLSDNMNVVTNAKHCFYNCSNVSGEVPDFRKQPSANKQGAYAEMTPSKITNWDQVSDYSTAEVYHGANYLDPFRGNEDEYLD